MDIVIGLVIGVIMGIFMGMYFKIILRKIFHIVPIYEQYKYEINPDCFYNLNIKIDYVKEEITFIFLSKIINNQIVKEYHNLKFNYDYFDYLWSDKTNDKIKYIYEYLYVKHTPLLRKDFIEFYTKKYILKKFNKNKENIDFNRLNNNDIRSFIDDIIQKETMLYSNLTKNEFVWSTTESQLDEILNRLKH